MSGISQKKDINLPQRLLNIIPIQGVFCLCIIQLLVFIPLYMPGANSTLYFRHISLWQFDLYLPVLSILLGHSFVTYAFLSGLLLIAGQRCLAVGAIILFLQFLAMLVSVYYYTFFGGYPKIQVVYDFIGSPATVFGYGMTAIGLIDIIIISTCCMFSLVLIKYALQPLRRFKNNVDIFAFSLIIGVSFIGTGLYITNMPKTRVGFSVAQYHSLPSYMWWGSLMSSFSGNSIELVKEYIPVKKQQEFKPPLNAPDHIILIIAESLRADHFPFYGYERNTMPRLLKSSDEWVVFKNFYTSEPTTSAAFSSALGSRYLSIRHDQHATRSNSSFFWKSLSQKAYRTSIFSSGRLKWGNMYKLISADQVDEFFSYTTASDDEKRLFSLPDRIDYHLNDWILFKHYANFCKTVTEGRQRSISVFYTVNTHFPYYSYKDDQKFYPALQEEDPSSDTSSIFRLGSKCKEVRERCINTYDNSIISFDRFLNELQDLLKKNNMLERSLLIVTADHGESFGEHGPFFHGSTLFNEVVHVPLLIRVGRDFPEIRTRLNQNRDEIYSTVDIAPTILESVGIKHPETFEGTSMISLTPKHYDILTATIFEKVAVVSKGRKHIFEIDTQKTLAFDLQTDQQELNNLWVHNESNLASFLKMLEARQVIPRKTQ